MKYNVLTYLIGEGISNIFKNKKQAATSFGTMCVIMIFFGICFILVGNFNNFIKQVEAEQGIQAYITNDATDEEVKTLGEEINALDGVNTIEFVSKEQGLNTMKEKLKDEKGVLDGFNVQKIKASYIVKVTDLERSKTIQDEVEKIDNVVKITNSNETAMKLISIAKIIRIATGVILLLLIIISTFIISNTIKLTVHSRRKEISIMKYVGATNSFIRWPFIVEGIVIGIISSMISILIVGGTYNIITTKMAASDFVRVMGMNLVGLNEMLVSIIAVYLILGIGIGTVGSVVSMRKYLKV